MLQRKGLDIIQAIPEAERDVAILEEPEHLNWYRHGDRWTDHFAHVVGVAHTNYEQYAQMDPTGGGWYKSPVSRFFTYTSPCARGRGRRG